MGKPPKDQVKSEKEDENYSDYEEEEKEKENDKKVYQGDDDDLKGNHNLFL